MEGATTFAIRLSIFVHQPSFSCTTDTAVEVDVAVVQCERGTPFTLSRIDAYTPIATKASCLRPVRSRI